MHYLRFFLQQQGEKDPSAPDHSSAGSAGSKLMPPLSADVPRSVQLLQKDEPAYMFWHNCDFPCSSEVVLPEHLVQGALSCVRNSGLKAVLLGFQTVQNLPAGVEWRDCRAYLDQSDFEKALEKKVLRTC